MKTILPITGTPTHLIAKITPLAAVDATTISTHLPRRPAFTENLMPFGAVAKTLFVKANGLPAYYVSTGTVGCFD